MLLCNFAKLLLHFQTPSRAELQALKGPATTLYKDLRPSGPASPNMSPNYPRYPMYPAGFHQSCRMLSCFKIEIDRVGRKEEARHSTSMANHEGVAESARAEIYAGRFNATKSSMNLLKGIQCCCANLRALF